MTLQRLPHTGNTPLYQHHTRLFIALTTQDTRTSHGYSPDHALTWDESDRLKAWVEFHRAEDRLSERLLRSRSEGSEVMPTPSEVEAGTERFISALGDSMLVNARSFTR